MPLNPEQPVEVYRNLSRGGWSLRQAGRVQERREEVALRDVTFKVRPGGRDQVRRGGHKQVHAWATGWLSERGATPFPARYNPLDCDTFVLREGGQPLHTARHAFFDLHGRLHVSEHP